MLSILKNKSLVKIPEEVSGIPVRFSKRARRMSLSVDVKSGEVVLTWPKGASERAAEKFIKENSGWIEKHRGKAKNQQVFFHGSVISVYGREYKIEHLPGRGLTRLEGDMLIVHGRHEHLSRRIKDFLKKHAKEILTLSAAEKLEKIDRQIVKIRVIDPKTRWGSCSPDGVLMFSWRLILMPPLVLDYIVAHEVAHCIHMNHSKSFWTLCSQLTEDAAESRRWVRQYGMAIMGYC